MVVPGAALADVKVYGKFNVGLEGQKDEIGLDSKDADTTFRVKDQNNSSRLGFKGSHDTGLGDMSVIYQLEFGTNPDGDESDELSQRNTYLGLKGNFGTVKVGKFDTPVKVIGGTADQFNDESIGDITELMVGETRANNMIQYETPKLGDLVTITAAVAPGEGREALDDANDEDNGVADTYYAAAEVEQGPFYAALAYAGNQEGSLKFDGDTAGIDIIRATVAVELMEALEIGAIYQQASGIDQDNGIDGGDAEETSWVGSVAYSYDAFKFKVQYGQTSGDQTDIDRTELAVGVDYKLSKSMTAQAYYVTYEDEGRTVGGIDDPQTDAYGLGLVFKF